MKNLIVTLFVFSSVCGFAGTHYYESVLDGSAIYLSIDSSNNSCSTTASLQSDENSPLELKKITQDCTLSEEELVLSNKLMISTCVNNEFRREGGNINDRSAEVFTKYTVLRDAGAITLTNTEDAQDSFNLVKKSYPEYKAYVRENCTK